MCIESHEAYKSPILSVHTSHSRDQWRFDSSPVGDPDKLLPNYLAFFAMHDDIEKPRPPPTRAPSATGRARVLLHRRESASALSRAPTPDSACLRTELRAFSSMVGACCRLAGPARPAAGRSQPGPSWKQQRRWESAAHGSVRRGRRAGDAAGRAAARPEARRSLPQTRRSLAAAETFAPSRAPAPGRRPPHAPH